MLSLAGSFASQIGNLSRSIHGDKGILGSGGGVEKTPSVPKVQSLEIVETNEEIRAKKFPQNAIPKVEFPLSKGIIPHIGSENVKNIFSSTILRMN